ncbi:MAG: ferrous iron transport protein B [Saprospiraceae bacterium]|jgi:ferrous iron transport protein B
MKLSELQHDQEAVITKVRGRGAFRKRILEMGFVKGQKISIVKGAPLRDPIVYRIMDYEVSLRKSEGSLIEVLTKDEAKNVSAASFEGVLSDDELKISASKKGKNINIALVGNPNCGKTTLYNKASHSRAKVGNYSGVTVDTHEAVFEQDGYRMFLTDLPGTYSLSAYTPEELFVRKHLVDNDPDIIINVVDASNLERNLYLTTQLIDLDIKVIIALNMHDELESKGVNFDYKKLGDMIGIPIIPTVSTKGKGVDDLFKKAIEVYEDRDQSVRHVHMNYGKNIEKSIGVIQQAIRQKSNYTLTDKISSRFLAVKLIERDKDAVEMVTVCENHNEIRQVTDREVVRLEEELDTDSETLITDAKYGFIAGALKGTYFDGPKGKRKKSQGIDILLTHKIWGFPIFIFFMWLMFQSTFTVGAYPMEWIKTLVSFSGDGLSNLLGPGMLRDLLVDGIIGGVGGVIIFLPNILILFFFISLMEDTGYIARAAFIMDKLMHFLGLHGKSFIPLIMGFGCNVPAIMATRTLESRNNRLLTMLINPFMSCSARLPVYILLIGAFFQDNPGTVLFSMYIIGILLSIVMAVVFKKTLFKLDEVPFVMELPPYRVPTFKSTMIHMWEKGFQYLKKMGGVILFASIVIWALGYFPREVNYSKDYDTLITQSIDIESDVALLKIQKESERFEGSYIGKIGHFIEPAIRPLGFDWKMGISLITGMAAKELVVSTMGVLYQVGEDTAEDSEDLINQLQSHTYQYGDKKGEKVFTPLVAYGFMLFILIYFPCIAVIAAIKKESGGWKWAIFTMVYTTGLAYFVSFVVYQIGSIFI